jgi:hypothetical protein
MSTMRPEGLITLNDILTAWQAGRIGYRQAMDWTDIDSLGGLYEAARMSGVPVRKTLSEREAERTEAIAQVLRDAGWP